MKIPALTPEQAAALGQFLPEGADLATRVKAACRTLAVPYAALGEATGIKPLRLSRIFNERGTATPDEIARICAALGLSVSDSTDPATV